MKALAQKCKGFLLDISCIIFENNFQNAQTNNITVI